MWPKVLHVAETIKGGIASYLDEIIPYQAAQFGAGNVGLLLPRSQLGELPAARGVRVWTFDDDCGRPRRVLRIRRMLPAVEAEFGPNVVHAHGSFAGIATRIPGLAPRAPVVYCSHGWAFDRESSRLKNAVIAAIERLLAPSARVIVCISRHDYRSGLRAGIEPTRLKLVENGIADQAAQGATTRRDGKCTWLFAGRFDRQKGVDIFLEAMRRMQHECHGVLLGGTVLADETLADVPPNVAVRGWAPRDEVQREIAAADAIVMPSRWEGFGLIAIEAMRASRPVIATRVGGLGDLVIDGWNGRVVEPNSVDSLVKVLRACNRASLAGMGENARRFYLASYTAQKLNRALFRLYLDAVRPTEPATLHERHWLAPAGRRAV
ncbi:glycosyltransferase [Derxia gummosa]|uniref:Glycosyltransferase n=1 Tax=Derxia gummosa DSM 723 TaxID=1121388 RepID=A0A8B6X9C5_9BURK|nr:glycosyltransferase [Derxia gummosa]